MRGCAAAVLLVLSLHSLDSSGQCLFPARQSTQFRSTAYDVAPAGDGLWVATGYGVQLLDPGAEGFDILGSAGLPGSTRVIASRGTDLAYAGSGSRIFVLRRAGRGFSVVRSVSAPGVVNDIVVTSTHLFVATRSGIAHYDVLDPANPIRTSAVLTTSRANVTSLAHAGNNLYAADGDATVEIFNVSIPSLPQRTGSLETLPRAGAVHAGADGFLYVSDEIGMNTDIFAGSSRIARVPYGSVSFATTVTGAVLVGGSDRTLRALDLTDPSRPVEIFEAQLAPTGGTSNAIYALARSGNELYVAAGDIGLLTFDVSSLALPYPLLSSTGGATTSALLIEGSAPKAYFTTAAGTLTESSLQLGDLRTQPAAGGTLHDSRGSDLLMSEGATVTLRTFTGTTSFSATFRAAVTTAAVAGESILALLADQSVWSVRIGAGSTPEQVDAGGAKIAYLARHGSSWALAEVRSDGTTVVHLPSRKLIVDGAATGGLALSSTHAAVFTYRGLNLVDLTTGAVSVLPDSTGVIPKQLHFAGANLLVLGERVLTVWDTARRSLARTHPLPANAVDLYPGTDRAVIATDEGMLVIRYLGSLPFVTSEATINRYYTKALTGKDRLYLFGSDGVDVYSTVTGLTPAFVAAVREPGVIDVAAGPETFYTLAGDGTVTAYSRAAAVVAQTRVQYGTDPQPLAIFTAGDAVWVSLSTGCRGTACAKWTLVLDPRTLAVTGMFEGATVDVTVSGTRAYALLDLPGDLAAFDISRPLQPSLTARVAAPAGSVSIASAERRVLVLAEKLYSFTESLAPAGDYLQAAAGAQQQIEIAGSCAVVIGRAENPELYDAVNFTSASPLIEVPSAARSIATQPGRLYILTEHSLEVWATTQPASPTRRRAAR